jgi:hypothetical protein
MSASAHSKSHWPAFSMLAAFSVLHAVAISGLGAAAFIGGYAFIGAKVWTLLAWLWLIWPVALIRHPRRSTKTVRVTLAVSVLLLLPCLPFMLVFSAWSVGGFGP